VDESVNHKVVRMLNEAYFGMRASRAAEDTWVPGSLLLEGLETLTKMDIGDMFVTINALDPGAVRFLAAQAIMELDGLGWKRPEHDQ
jgi:hypothetical protein